MTATARTSAAAIGLLQRDLLIFVSYRLRFITQTAAALFSLVIFYYVSRLVTVEPFTPDAYFAFVVVGLVIFGVLTSTFNSAAVLRQELVAGTFERLVMSPFGAVGSIFSLTLFPFMAALVNGLMIVLLAVAAFDLQVQWSTAALAVPIALLGALAFMPFGVAIAAAVLVLKQAASVGNFVVAGISIVAGLYFPVELLPSWVEWLSEVQPFTPAVELLRHVLVGTPLDQPAIEAVAKLAAFAVVLLPLATLLLGRALSAARRRGTIIEY